ncbi:MAG TPA: glycoside hydrolase family 44 protein, partial [Verrucomicrobiae bacterium]|nr:glycoside hydrolase family 44 protein [Verrucomicrobiae bacterium]
MAKVLLLWKDMQMLKGCASGKRSFTIASVLLAAGHLLAQSSQNVYTDSLQNGWANWSWATVNLNNPSPVHAGSSSISVSSTNWQALYLHHTPQNGGNFANLAFWINGGSGGQSLRVQAHRNGVAQTSVVLAPLPANSWRQEILSLASLGVGSAADFDGFWLQVENSGLAPTFYVDDIVLTTNSAANPGVALNSPAPGDSYFAPATISFAATVTTNGHTIDRVQFYNGAALHNEDSSPPYNYTWPNVGVGNYTVKARVLFNMGLPSAGSSDSAPANISVASNVPVAITVNAALNKRPINPLIYGVAFASSSQLNELNAPLNRWGGNSTTRYNWQLNADNKANDWYYQSIAGSSATPGADANNFVSSTKAGGAEPILTIPMIDWMPKLGPGRSKLASYSISKYGPQAGNDWQWMPDAGNGVGTNAGTTWLITTNNPNDANFLTNSAFQQAWVQHLTNTWGRATNGGIRYYCMDNEHTLWYSTHRDIHPAGP